MVRRGFRSGAVVVAAASAALIASGAPASAQPGSADLIPPGFPCIHTNVYPIASWGWGSIEAAPPRFAAGTGASGAGYLDMYTPANAQTNYFHPGINTPLGQLGTDSLAFWHQGATSFQLRLRGANRPDDLSGFTTLVWEPAYNDIDATNWRYDGKLATGQWWSTRDIGGLKANAAETATLAQIAAANPLAFVTEYGVSAGRTNQILTGGADDITYGCARWDFEPMPSGSG